MFEENLYVVLIVAALVLVACVVMYRRRKINYIVAPPCIQVDVGPSGIEIVLQSDKEKRRLTTQEIVALKQHKKEKN